jgi:hypothetical protein
VSLLIEERSDKEGKVNDARHDEIDGKISLRS